MLCCFQHPNLCNTDYLNVCELHIMLLRFFTRLDKLPRTQTPHYKLNILSIMGWTFYYAGCDLSLVNDCSTSLQSADKYHDSLLPDAQKGAFMSFSLNKSRFSKKNEPTEERI